MDQAKNKQQEMEQGRMQIEGGSSHEARQEKDKGRGVMHRTVRWLQKMTSMQPTPRLTLEMD